MGKSRIFKLRDYQEPRINDMIRHITNPNINMVLLYSCVGSGKTIMTKAMLSQVLKKFQKVIIASPFNTISSTFVNHSEEIYNRPSQEKIDKTPFILEHNSIIAVKPNIAKNIELYLRSGKTSHALSISHASLAKLYRLVKEKKDLKGHLIIIDEAHRSFNGSNSEETKMNTILGKLIRSAINKGAKVLYCSATPYRIDGVNRTIPILNDFDESMTRSIERTIGEHIQEGYAPNLEAVYFYVEDLKIYNKKQETIFGDEVNVTISDKSLNKCIYEIARQWMEDGCPKTFIRIPSVKSPKKALRVKKIFESLVFSENIQKMRNGRIHPVVLNTVTNDKFGISKSLQDDNDNHGRNFDIVVACRKMDEGTDCNTLTHCYVIGIASNVRLWHQIVGRILRKKESDEYIKWFGDKFLNNSKITFLIPPKFNLKELGAQASRQLIHCLLASEDYKVYSKYMDANSVIKNTINKRLNYLKDSGAGEEEIAKIEEILNIFTNNKIMQNIRNHEMQTNIFKEMCIQEKDLTFSEYRDKIVAGLEGHEKSAAIVSAFNSLDDTEENKKLLSNAVDLMLNRVTFGNSGSWGNRKPSKRQDKLAPSMLTVELEPLLNVFENHMIRSEKIQGAMKVMSDISGDDYTMYAHAAKMLCFKTDEEDEMMLKYTGKFLREHNNVEPSASSKDPEERKLALWRQIIKSHPERKLKLVGEK